MSRYRLINPSCRQDGGAIILNGMALVVISFMALLLMACKPEAAPPAAPASPAKNPAAPQAASWETEWARTVAEGKKEGTVVVYTGLDSGARDAMQTAFKEKFGITLQFEPAMGAALMAKVRAERTAGMYIGDLILSGAATQLTFKDTGFLDPVEDFIILPEVKDPKAWPNGKFHFLDKDRYTMAYWATVSTTWFVNTDLLKPEEVSSFKDLLDPKWKGKMTLVDPSTPGPGSKFVNINAWEIMGESYVRSLAKQDILVTRDQRLHVESVARGKYLIGLGPQSEVRVNFQRQGAPIKTVLPLEGGAITSGAGALGILNKPYHPNATRVFINWLLSKEGQTVVGTGGGTASRRLDVPTGHVDEDKLMKAGGKYIEGDTEETIRREVQRQAMNREIFQIR